MYVRSRKPAAGIASASTTRYETSSARYISTESAKYGTSEVAMSSRLRPRRGRVYGARASRQKGRSLPGPKLGAAPIAAAGSRVLLAPCPLASAATGAPAARGFPEDPRALLTPAAERAASSTRARNGSRPSGGAPSRRGCCLRPAKTGGGAVGGPLQLPELALAGRSPTVEPGPIEGEALAAVARLLAQLLSLVARRLDPLERAGRTFALERLAVHRPARGRGRPTTRKAAGDFLTTRQSFADDDMGSTLIDQLAFARFVDGGDFARYLRWVRPVYRGRRDATIEALERHLPEARS